MARVSGGKRGGITRVVPRTEGVSHRRARCDIITVAASEGRRGQRVLAQRKHGKLKPSIHQEDAQGITPLVMLEAATAAGRRTTG